MQLETFIKNLEQKGYQVTCFDTGEEACRYLDSQIDGKTVGIGDSQTIYDMGLYEKLIRHNRVWDPKHRPDQVTFDEEAKKTYFTQIYLLSVNGAVEDGTLINLDGTGNRVGSGLFGHEKVYYVFSLHKVEPTLEKALWRVRNIAAPKNAKRIGYTTPCAIKGDRCYDCNHPDRVCNGLVVNLHKMKKMDVEVVLIKEELGF